MKSKLALIAASCLLATAAAQPPWAEGPERSRAQVYTLEGLGALGGVACCGGLSGGALYLLASSVESDPVAEAGGAMVFVLLAIPVMSVFAAATPAVAGYCVASVGERLGEDGSTGWAIGGAYAGSAVGGGVFLLGAFIGTAADPRGKHTSCWLVPSCVLSVLAIPTGAVLGYNLGAPREAAGPYRPGIGSRLEMPAVALTSTELPDHSVEYGVRVQLAGLRF